MPEIHERGLPEKEAAARRARGLGNVLPSGSGRSYGAIIRENALTFMNGVIFALGLALLALGQPTDALVSVGVVSINVVVGLVQEVRAKRVLDRIAILTRPRARVIRDGVERAVDPAEVVSGDILVLRPGDQVIVDGPIRSGRIEADEALLTGESDPVTRSVGERVLSGSFCVAGSTRYEATAVGTASYAHQLVAGARAPRRVRTPLQRQVELVVRVLLFVAGSFAVIVVASAAVDEATPVEIVRRAVVVVGLVPNGLFLAIATAYALGAVRMAGRGVLVQQSNAVESMSNVDVLCLDKTGTITTGRLGIEGIDDFGAAGIATRRLLGDFAATAVPSGRTLDAIRLECPASRRPVRDEVVFSSELRWSGLVFADGPEGAVMLGAPELFIALDAAHSPAVGAAVARSTQSGLRALLLVRAPLSEFPRDADGRPQLPDRVTPVALIAFRDELRSGVRETMTRFVESGIQLKVVSGDHPETVRSLAGQSGLAADGRVILGSEIAAADDASLRGIATQHTIFARVGPAEKERLIRALRAEGRYVAMLGDGVNDVPAMKAAHLAIAIHEGTQAARAVSDLVLLDNSFAALPIAFGEGQRILSAMQSVLRLFLARIVYVALIIAATALVDVGFPYTPKQTALLSFLTVGVPTIVLTVIARPVAHVREHLIASLVRFVVPAAWSLALVGLFVYLGYASAVSVARAQSSLTLLTILAGIALAMFAAPPTRGWTGAGSSSISGWPSAALGIGLVVALGWIVMDPDRRSFFDLGAMAPADIVAVLLVSAVWALMLRAIWRRDLFERALGMAVVSAPRHLAAKSVR